MKIAVCYSGICRGNWIKNNTSVKYHFPKADYFYSTWSTQVASMPPIDYKTYVEPKMNYHPMKDVDKNLLTMKLRQNLYLLNGKQYYDRTMNHTKQILAHAYQLRDLSEEYDMIVRIRYDTYLSPKVNFTDYLNKSYNENIAVGFGTRTSRHKHLGKLLEIDKTVPSSFDDNQDWYRYLMDPMIFHPRKLFDTDMVFKYHREKKLLPAENGWYQILSEPYGDNHLSVYGGAQIEKYLSQTIL